MNCIDAQDLLQRRLDGGATDDSAALAQHLAGCADCRTLYAAVGRLEAGLRLLRAPVPPAGLQRALVGGVLKDISARRRRRVLVGMGLAASVLVASWIGLAASGANDGLVPNPFRQIYALMSGLLWPEAQESKRMAIAEALKVEINSTPEQRPSLRASVAEAGSAVAALTRRTTTETVEQTRLLTEVLPAPTNVLEAVPPMPEQPIITVWQETSQRVATGFEPVTTSARRALSMLLRDNPRPVNQ